MANEGLGVVEQYKASNAHKTKKLGFTQRLESLLGSKLRDLIESGIIEIPELCIFDETIGPTSYSKWFYEMNIDEKLRESVTNISINVSNKKMPFNIIPIKQGDDYHHLITYFFEYDDPTKRGKSNDASIIMKIKHDLMDTSIYDKINKIADQVSNIKDVSELKQYPGTEISIFDTKAGIRLSNNLKLNHEVQNYIQCLADENEQILTTITPIKGDECLITKKINYKNYQGIFGSVSQKINLNLNLYTSFIKQLGERVRDLFQEEFSQANNPSTTHNRIECSALGY